jgi:excisionase family DNA binding protein
MGVEEVSRITGLHPETIREYCRDGRLKARHIGRTWVIEPRDLKAFQAKPRQPGRPRKEGKS